MLRDIYLSDFAGMENCPKCGRMHVKGRGCTADPKTYAGLEEEELAELYEREKYEKEYLKQVKQTDMRILRMRF